MAQTHIQIHEDDVGMRVLYPAAAAPAVLNDLAQAQAEAEANRLPSGFWSDVHSIKEPEESFRNSGLTLKDASRALCLLPRIRTFSSGYGGDLSLASAPDAQCYGFGAHLYIKLEVTEGALDAIWFDVTRTTKDERCALRAGLERLDAATPLVLADYWMNMGGLVRDTAFMDRYFAELAVTSERMAKPSPPPRKQGSWIMRLLRRG
ncbi:hypothetical protein ACN2XU_02835 [Primorskyibacter sp. 2E107]|uniref:hypothetical protein n=1 Tax=Primorskyibacter sp. 2E107 TaxID=3403458 RepID=UPI003AF629CA